MIHCDMLKTTKYLAALLMLVMACSCKSLQRLGARDSSISDRQRVAANHKSRDITFIDGIAVQPGTLPAPPAALPKQPRQKSKVEYAPPTDIILTTFNIEGASGLQFKYAIMLDASVERLTNTVLLQHIDRWWGTHYCLGGSTENCIDCSAFTQVMMRDVYQADVPRTARAQYDNSTRITMEELEEGDLVFFKTTGSDISHVGIYLTNNKFVHAATSGGVMLSDLNDVYWRPRYRGAGRVAKQGLAMDN